MYIFIIKPFYVDSSTLLVRGDVLWVAGDDWNGGGWLLDGRRICLKSFADEQIAKGYAKEM